MVLKNKDGSVYKLQGPNPAMKDQNLWGDFVAHNMEWNDEKIKDNNKKEYQAPMVPENNFIKELEKTKPVEQEKTQIEEVKEEKIEIKSSIKQDSAAIKKTYIHLLPAIRKERKDDFYGDSCVTIEYKDPTSFEGVVIKQSDIYFEVWTDVPDIGIGSVLYPKSNVKRWWRVQEVLPKASGWILSCTLSDYQPAFKS